MDRFFEIKVTICVLYLTVLFSAKFRTDAIKIECIKSDECSCKTNSKPQQEMSLWPIPSRKKVESGPGESWLYDIDLCHGLSKNVDAADGGCSNATVCQYSSKEKESTFDIGQFGNVTFGQYDNETKKITLQYYGILQQNITRSIDITLKCDENGNVARADYDEVISPIFLGGKFTTIITTKAACLRPVLIPQPTSRSNVGDSDGGLKTVYIVVIAVAGFLIVLAVGSYVAYKIVVRRRSGGLLNEEEENEDYGTVPRVHVQNALSTPVSGPV